ncbi:MAG: type II secretion system protein [Candidatus Riflebacteria bacterium]|jgi:prepilin-type N-terminal cleavage/methylation domain-containing protein|nr:type II secretion system protein [Candidatus Riflebacteria bacterium]
MQITDTKIYGIREGFSLIEILISLLVLSGALATMFSGFESSSMLDMQAGFESEAAFMAERELELVKSDLLAGRLKPVAAGRRGRFKMKPGWKIATTIADRDDDGATRIQVSASRSGRNFMLESFVYVPKDSTAMEAKQ